jgi:superfamily II DNA or RNA helicase
VNLSNCQIGIYANIGSSKVVELQRLGRILRHENPLIVIPFFTGTREEEIVNGMVQNYNPELITTLFKSQINKEALEDIINGESDIQQADD